MKKDDIAFTLGEINATLKSLHEKQDAFTQAIFLTNEEVSQIKIREANMVGKVSVWAIVVSTLVSVLGGIGAYFINKF